MAEVSQEQEQVLMVALGQLAAFRGAEVQGKTLLLFARRLLHERCEVRDVVEACRRLELSEREDGELAFPSLGTLLRHTREVLMARQAHAREARQTAARALADGRPSVIQGDMSKAEAKAFIDKLKRDVAAQRLARKAPKAKAS